MKRIDPVNMTIGKKYVSEHKTNYTRKEFTFFGIDGDGSIMLSSFESFLPGYFNYYETEQSVQWVKIPSDVPLKFRPKNETDTDWYVGWFNSTSYAFYGIVRGETEATEFLEGDIIWETL